jgi:hypothetical protein
MRKRPCPAALKIAAELYADICQETFNRTRSQRALVRLVDARRKAMKA